MAKKKIVSKVEDKKVSKEKLADQIKATPMVPGEMFSETGELTDAAATVAAPIDEAQLAESINNIEQSDIEGVMADPKGPDFLEDNGLGFDESKPRPMTNEELTTEYELMRQVSYQMIEKQYVIEWKIFGEDYKGKYRTLQVNDKTWLIGTTHLNLKYISAPSKKEAYLEYIADKS